ncbi:hypothetical protein PHLCEN_2v4579 [Hermanssonia centrifuga]|uniref:F-box domain-containing protein n=1 Tax=Hermanssonia centrifuga TaxID=98765 RepID=A0A2R6PN67_9APHY|nr:hypothetical protein PHLCEN_2v4579 [Hermanssonia centrifuga]
MLRQIILQYRALYEEERKKSAKRSRHRARTRYGPYGWIRITHVCTLWRAVALETSRLWVDLHLTRLECVEAMLVRSKATPVTVNWHKGNLSLLQPVLRELNRVQSLEILFDEEIWQASNDIYPATFPLPTKLHTLRVGGDVSFAFRENARLGLSIPSIFGQGLRILSVKERRKTQWPLQPFSLLTVLKNLPLLEELDLDVGLGSVNDLSMDSSLTVTLPHLRSLSMRCDSTACLYLLEHLIPTDEARIMLDVQSALDPDFLPEAASIWQSKFPDSTSTALGAILPLQTFRLYYENNRAYLRGWRDLLSLAALNEAECQRQVADLKVSCTSWEIAPVFDYCCDLPLADIQTLQILTDWEQLTGGEELDIAIYLWLDNLSRVHTLSVAASAMKTLSDVLKFKNLLPRLTTLEFHCECSKGGTTYKCIESEDLGNLAEGLKSRKDCHLGIKTIIIPTCINRSSWVLAVKLKKMKPFVDEWRWQMCDDDTTAVVAYYTR